MPFHPILVDGFDNYTVGVQRWTVGGTFHAANSSGASRHAWGLGGWVPGHNVPAIELPPVNALIWEGAVKLHDHFVPGFGPQPDFRFGKQGVALKQHVHFMLSDTRHPYFRRGEDNAVILGPTIGPTRVVELDVWYWFQVYILIHETLGAIHFKVNGDTWLEGTGLNTKHSEATAFIDWFAAGTQTGSEWYLDDFVWQDGEDGEFQGDMVVLGKRPAAPGYITEFDVVGAGANWQAVDEAEADDDTSYVHSTTTGERDAYLLDKITEVPGSSIVLAVQQAFRHRKDEPGVRSVTPFIRVDTDELVGEERFPSESAYLTTIEAMHLEQPAGGDWGTVDEFNALDVEVGQEVGDGEEGS